MTYPVKSVSALEKSADSSSLVPALPPSNVRVALLLPLHSEALGQAANAIRAGFLAAYAFEKSGIAVDVIDTGDNAEEVLTSYTGALTDHDVIVGPLSRSAVSAISQSDAVRKPTIALNGLDQSNSDMPLPKQLLLMGLSVEDEARQIALWAGANKPEGKAWIIVAGSPWQRRAAKAFAQKWMHLSRESEIVELNTSTGYLSAASLAQLKTKMQSEKPALMFLALDVDQIRETRMIIGKEIALYATSQLNTVALADRTMYEPMPELNGIRLVDLPWQIQPDHTAVMIYPHLEVAADQKRNVDMERLYALGIDAFRVAREIAMHNSTFEIDGVTGKLAVRFSATATHLERIEQQAIYRDGVAIPVVKMP